MNVCSQLHIYFGPSTSETVLLYGHYNQASAKDDDHFVIKKSMLTITDPGVETRDDKPKEKIKIVLVLGTK